MRRSPMEKIRTIPPIVNIRGASAIIWPGSSVGQNTSLSHQRSWVQTPSRSPIIRHIQQKIIRIDNPVVVGSIPTYSTFEWQLRWQSARKQYKCLVYIWGYSIVGQCTSLASLEPEFESLYLHQLRTCSRNASFLAEAG